MTVSSPSSQDVPSTASNVSNTSVAIDIQNLSKTYSKAGTGSFKAVDDITLQVRQGECFGLLGPNGAGKTTLIAMLSTLLKPTRGTAELMGHDIARARRQVQRSIGLVPQDLALYSALSAQDNLTYFASLYGITGKQGKQRCEEVLAAVNLSERAGDVVDTLSGGMKRRLNIAVGLLHSPQILFLDEPTVGVDPQSRNFIFEHVEALNAQGMTIIYTSHYMEEVERLCKRVAIMDEGKLLALDSAQTLIEQTGGGLLHMSLRQDLEDEVAHELKSLEHVTDVQHHAVESGYAVQLHSQQPLSIIREATQLVSARGYDISVLEVQQASLETVFLALTGKQLRD